MSLAAEVDDEFAWEGDWKRMADLEEVMQCVICRGIMDAVVGLPCGHCFCSMCIRQSLEVRAECPECRAKAGLGDMKGNKTLQRIVSTFRMIKPGLVATTRRLEADARNWRERGAAAVAAVAVAAAAAARGAKATGAASATAAASAGSKDSGRRSSRGRLIKSNSMADDSDDEVLAIDQGSGSGGGGGGGGKGGRGGAGSRPSQSVIPADEDEDEDEDGDAVVVTVGTSRSGASAAASSSSSASASAAAPSSASAASSAAAAAAAAAKVPQPMAPTHYGLIKKPALKSQLLAWGLSDKGDEDALKARHKLFVQLHNAAVEAVSAGTPWLAGGLLPVPMGPDGRPVVQFPSNKVIASVVARWEAEKAADKAKAAAVKSSRSVAPFLTTTTSSTTTSSSRGGSSSGSAFRQGASSGDNAIELMSQDEDEEAGVGSGSGSGSRRGVSVPAPAPAAAPAAAAEAPHAGPDRGGVARYDARLFREMARAVMKREFRRKAEKKRESARAAASGGSGASGATTAATGAATDGSSSSGSATTAAAATTTSSSSNSSGGGAAPVLLTLAGYRVVWSEARQAPFYWHEERKIGSFTAPTPALAAAAAAAAAATAAAVAEEERGSSGSNTGGSGSSGAAAEAAAEAEAEAVAEDGLALPTAAKRARRSGSVEPSEQRTEPDAVMAAAAAASNATSAAAAAADAAPPGWACAKCTFHNRPRMQICGMCRTKKGQEAR